MPRNVYRAPDSNRNAAPQYSRQQASRQAPSRRAARYEEDAYEDDDYEWEEEQARRKARKGCLVVFLVFLVILLVATLVGGLFAKNEMDGNNATATEAIQVVIVSGTSAKTIGESLQEKGIIGSGMLFRYYVSFKKAAPGFIAGTHTITPGMTYDEIITTLSTAPPAREEITVRIPEGVSIMKVASLFEEAGIGTAQEFLDTADNLDLFTDIPFIQKIKEEFDADPSIVVFHRAEGLLYPDTYNFYKDDTVENVVRKLYEQMDGKITEEMYARMDELGITLRQAITLASMIQAEASHVDQQAKVSGVFWNRLSSDWQQQDGTMGSDVTVRYVRIWMQWNIPEYADKTYTEISYDTARAAVGDELFYAYVTDSRDAGTRKGLPAGPICSISETALAAALNPEQHDYYYFLTDYYENYYYGKTLAEHNRNVATMEQKNAQYLAEQANSEANTAA